MAGEKGMREVLSRNRGFQAVCSLTPDRADCLSVLAIITLLHEKNSRCLSCYKSVFTIHCYFSLKDTAFSLVPISSLSYFLKFLDFFALFFLPRKG